MLAGVCVSLPVFSTITPQQWHIMEHSQLLAETCSSIPAAALQDETLVAM